MAKTFTDLDRRALNGATMGTRWAALIHVAPAFDTGPLQADLQAAVDEVDAQMSTWRADSDLMRLNAAPLGRWVYLPPALMMVLDCALQIGRMTDGAFDIGLGDAVLAWGFGSASVDQTAIAAAMTKGRRPTHETLELDLAGGRARSHQRQSFDLSGIAKGYGVDRLAEVLAAQGLDSGLVSIDGEVRALGGLPDGSPWPVAIERPQTETRAIHSVLGLHQAAVATSGDYRHWVTVAGRHLSHTINPATGAPLLNAPASVTAVAPTCMVADALATALMVMGVDRGRDFARAQQIDALFLTREGDDIGAVAVGPMFSDAET